MKRIKDLIYIAVLVLFDQIIKLYIYFNHMEKNQDIINGFMSFHPIFNRDYSWVNSLFQFGIGLLAHIILVFIVLLIVLISYDYMRSRNYMTKTVWHSFMFIISSAICSIIDKIFWKGSLDYIYLEGFFIFDLKDVYASVFSVLIILSLILNVRKINALDEKKMWKDFTEFIRSRYLRFGRHKESDS